MSLSPASTGERDHLQVTFVATGVANRSSYSTSHDLMERFPAGRQLAGSLIDLDFRRADERRLCGRRA